MKKNLTTIVATVLFAFALQAQAQLQPQSDLNNFENLKGVSQLYLEVTLNSSKDADLEIQQEVADLVELELRRSGIPFRESLLNSPELNFPKIHIDVNIDRAGVKNNYRVTLRVLDHVIIKRNSRVIVGETYRLVRTASKSSEGTFMLLDIKSELRAAMQDFLTDFTEANSGN